MKICPYFQRNRAISFPVDCRHYIAETALAQEVAVLVNVLEFNGLTVSSNDLKSKCFDVFR